MEYSVYNYSSTDTMATVAKAFGVSVTELAKLNNLSMPLSPAQYFKFEGLPGYIFVPQTESGGRSYSAEQPPPLRKGIVSNEWNIYDPYDYSRKAITVGDGVQGQCYLAIEGNAGSVINNNDDETTGKIFFPCFPDSFTDTRSVSVSSQNPIGRSEPFQIYQNSGPRTVSVSFRMHREMNHFTPIEDIVKAVQSCTYPISGSRLAGGYAPLIIPRVRLVIGGHEPITGIIASDVSVTWSETLSKPKDTNTAWKYNVVELGFTVTECTGNPKTSYQVYSNTRFWGV